MWNKLLVVSILCIFSSIAICAAPAGYTKIWEDTFSGTSLDPANWSLGCRDDVSGDIIPGAAGTYLLNTGYAGYTTAEDVIVGAGSLTLQNQKRSYTGTDPAGSFDYTSGWINSMHKVHFNKGYLEMRAKLPSGDKVWPAYWMIAEDLTWGPEWDVWEYFGYRPDHGYDVMGMNLAYGTYPSISWLTDWIFNYDSIYDCEAWHTYGWEWTANYAKWWIDGVEVSYMENTIGNSWPDEEMYIVLNNGVRTDSPDATTTWPNVAVIDYIEIYQTQNDCGNGVCEINEDCQSCSADCIGVTGGNPRNRYCCGDGTCEAAENETNCAIDCGGGPVCGDSNCDIGEDQCNCPSDCGNPPATETNCDDDIDEDCDGNTDCFDSDCNGDPACPSCGDSQCDTGETQCNCPGDCGTPPSTETGNCTDGDDNDCDGNIDCADSDCTADPACQSGGPVVFEDDFESGDFVAGGWTVVNAQVHTQAVYTGVYGVKFQKFASIEKYISTAGKTGLTLEYDRRTVNYDPEDFFEVEWYDGSSWNLLEATQDTSWSHASFALPATADNNTAFRIRFTGNANKPTDKAFMDNVQLLD